ncbi:MAG: ADP-forming succinate--CoA ligase subunit beta [bacterium]
MKIHEYQAKLILKDYGIVIPRGEMAQSAKRATEIANGLRFPVVVKAQVHVGGRGKAGGVKLANSIEEVETHAKAILGMNIKGITVRKVLVEEAVDIHREIYLGIIIDRASKNPVMMASAAGGMEIEEVAAKTPDKILMFPVKPVLGLQPFQVRRLCFFLELPKETHKDFGAFARGLYQAFMDKDGSLAEINPLVLTAEGQVIACDAKFNFDDNALYRHPDVAALRDEGEEEPLEVKAREKKLNYVKLDGKIGCIVNGAGLAMATMDMVKHFGGEPANFLDIGGGAKAEQVTAALSLITSDPTVNTIFFNIFGGIVRCDLVAEGILEALKRLPGFEKKYPIVIRLSGTNEEKAREMLKGTDLLAVPTMSAGAKKAVETSKR